MKPQIKDIEFFKLNFDRLLNRQLHVSIKRVSFSPDLCYKEHKTSKEREITKNKQQRSNPKI